MEYSEIFLFDFPEWNETQIFDNINYPEENYERSSINQIISNKTSATTKTRRGRYKIKHNIKKIHSKYYSDNIRGKIKVVIFSSILTFLNIKLEGKYRLEKINAKIINDVNQKNNKILFEKKLKEIFSNVINQRSKKDKDYNKKIIDKIYESEDERLTKIFDRTLMECLQHINKTNLYEELNNLEQYFEEAKNKKLEKDQNDKQYIEKFNDKLRNFEYFLRI